MRQRHATCHTRSLLFFGLIASFAAQAACGRGRTLHATGGTEPPVVTPPNAPTVQAPDGVYLSGQTQIIYALTGTKDAGVNVELNGAVLVAADANTTWTGPVTIIEGDNLFTFKSVNTANLASADVPVHIFGSTLAGPTINPGSYTSPTNQTAQTLTGSKPADTDLWVSIDGSTPLDVGQSQASSWSYSFSLTGDGAHTAAFYVTQAGVAQHSPTATAYIVLKTSVPAKPTLTSPTLTTPLNDTGAATITLAGTVDAQSHVCVSSTSGGPCLVQSTGGGSFSVNVPLQLGNNPLYISARDDAGNVSQEIVTSIYRVSPPVLSNIVPAAGSVLTGATLAAQVDAASGGADGSRSSATIHMVGVCLDIGNCEPGTQSGATWAASFDVHAFLNGSTHTVSFEATNAVGLTTTVSVNFAYSNGAPAWVSNDNPTQPAVSPRMVADSGGAFHVVWQDYCSQAGSGCTVTVGATQQPPDIFYARRDSTGAWSSIAMVSSSGTDDGLSQSPAIAVDAAKNVHVAWADNGSGGGKPSNRYGIVHRVRNATTGTWGPIVAVGAPQAGIDDADPSLSVDATSGNVHMTWTRHTSASRYDIFYAVYSGGVWSTALQVTPATDPNIGIAERSSVAAAAQGRANVTWQECRTVNSVNYCNAPVDHDIYLREVVSAAALGYGPVLVTDLSKAIGYDGDSLQPSLLVDATNTAWVFWSDTSTLQHQSRQNIWMRQFVTGAATGSYTLISNGTTATLAAEQPSASLGPVSSDGSATIGVVWTQNMSMTNSDIWGRSGTVNSGVINAVQTIYPTPDLSVSPSLALDASSNFYVVWDDSTTFSGGVNTAGVDQIFYQFAAQ